MPLAAGDRFGPFEILDLIGKGGMGEVYANSGGWHSSTWPIASRR